MSLLAKWISALRTERSWWSIHRKMQELLVVRPNGAERMIPNDYDSIKAGSSAAPTPGKCPGV
jgi:hypothetical protein